MRAKNSNKMKTIYAIEDYNDIFKPTIFLAGPTPRSSDVISWRPKAVELIEKQGFDGAVFIPECRNGNFEHSYMNQIEWEHRFLNLCDRILMWIPRNLETMPAFTTNIEFGMYINHRLNKLYYGRPNDAPKNSYLDYCYYKFTRREPKRSLDDLVKEVVLEIEKKY